jgi:hypothetical protein
MSSPLCSHTHLFTFFIQAKDKVSHSIRKTTLTHMLNNHLQITLYCYDRFSQRTTEMSRDKFLDLRRMNKVKNGYSTTKNSVIYTVPL